MSQWSEIPVSVLLEATEISKRENRPIIIDWVNRTVTITNARRKLQWMRHRREFCTYRTHLFNWSGTV